MRGAIAGIRSFNRFMGRELGLAQEHFLGRARPYGHSRLLYEIGAGGAAVRELRVRMRLDSGYLSRMLGALRAEGLVTVEPHRSDRRTRIALLTRAGRAELGRLDRASDRIAASWLEGLDRGQAAQLLQALASVRRLLQCARVRVEEADPGSRAARECLRHYYGELDRRFAGGFRPGVEAGSGLADYRRPRGAFLLARLPSGEVVGCAGLRLLGEGVGEIKRMWVAPQARGAGVGRTLLSAVEHAARRRRLGLLRLDTNSALKEAIALYGAAGYRSIARYNANAYAQRWFEKRLPAPGRQAGLRRAAARRPGLRRSRS